MLQTEKITSTPEKKESIREKIDHRFNKIKRIISQGVEYIDSEKEKILMRDRGNKLIICKAVRPNEYMGIAPTIQNVKSTYTLIKNYNGNYSLETQTFKIGRGGINEMQGESYERLNNLSLGQVSQSLSKFESRLKEKNELAFRKMQNYSYNQEVQDKEDADQIINNLLSGKDNRIA